MTFCFAILCGLWGLSSLTRMVPRPFTVKGQSCAQLCPTLCDPMDYSPPGSSSMGFPRKECWEWVAISSS